MSKLPDILTGCHRGSHTAAVARALFFSTGGIRIPPTRQTERSHRDLVQAKIAKGVCHVWRHTSATLMHDGGADIRDIQEMLGHAQLSTTQIYTRVSIERLKAVHAKTHPATSLTRTRGHLLFFGCCSSC